LRDRVLHRLLACVVCCAGCDGWYEVRGHVRTPAGVPITGAYVDVYRGKFCEAPAEARTHGTSSADGTFSAGSTDPSWAVEDFFAVRFRKEGFSERCAVVPKACAPCESGLRMSKCCVVDQELSPARHDPGR
jgi:hypothetical protein